jgi:predicted ATP-binding protein involved in virulence
MIRTFEVAGLQNKWDYSFTLQPDLNILTGKNGSGKTTLLKLLWYCLSGNVGRIGAEMTFSSARLETSTFKLALTKDGDSDIVFDLEIEGVKISLEDPQSILSPLLSYTQHRSDPADIVRRHLAELDDASVFFPTFRRIEGGFASERRRRSGPRVHANPLQEALSDFSETFDVGNHHFIASISTDDIVSLLTSRFADISRQTNDLQQSLLNFITRTIGQNTPEKGDSQGEKLASAETTLNQIQTKITEIESKRNELLKPFEVLGKLVTRIFEHRGIKVTEAIGFGAAKEGITSDKLSAGEKQMLSFLCYNAFNSGSCIFIDEPEISLHIDWQRTLFPTLLEQSTSNQFIITTHSPFIYSKYADKELSLNPDKGVA